MENQTGKKISNSMKTWGSMGEFERKVQLRKLEPSTLNQTLNQTFSTMTGAVEAMPSMCTKYLGQIRRMDATSGRPTLVLIEKSYGRLQNGRVAPSEG